MGNAGSVHNLHNDCVDNEVNSYLKRTSGERKNKYNQVALGGCSSGRNTADCKVLPQPTKNLKLRATTNGAILQAGGTISFRAKEQSDSIKTSTREGATFFPMRRCHTLIFGGQNESIAHRKSAPPLPEFRRSQTLLHVGYTSTNSQNTKTITASTSTLKTGKYNKKSKAPLAPTKNYLNLTKNNSSSNQNPPAEVKATALVKNRIYTTHHNKTPVAQKQQQQEQQQVRKKQLPPPQTSSFQRYSKLRTSVNSTTTVQQSDGSCLTKLPYRRERSFDAVLLRQKDANSCNNRKIIQNSSPILRNKLEEQPDLDRRKNQKNELAGQLENIVDVPKLGEQFLSENCTSADTTHSKNAREELKGQTTTSERKMKHHQSRIPQLKRTFYFGMDSSNNSTINNSPAIETVHCRKENKTRASENLEVLHHNIVAPKEIIDNDILVHVRPTLPRRQHETPSFSPAAAWRNLLEEELIVQVERGKPKRKFTNYPVIEPPICLILEPQENNTSIDANWTPQQDLDDDDDDDDDDGDDEEDKQETIKLKGKLEVESEQRLNSLHIFSLSLPRDVHLQCQMKPSADYTDLEKSVRSANCWLVPGFNSLQKFKSHLGKNAGFRSNSKCTCAPNDSINRNTPQFQGIFGDSFVKNAAATKHQPGCDLNKGLESPSTYHNDNWLLHKSNSNDEPIVSSTEHQHETSLSHSLNARSIVHLQPKSLTNVCGGKHIVYLPGQDTSNASLNSSHNNSKQNKKTTKSTYKRQRQRHEIVRESLQDLTSIPNIRQSNTSMREKNTHRFSFQSTARVLEKRRLAEKLSKDAEIQEAQRLSELEAMKRVEEDFQRKRAPEKANLRKQLQLHLKAVNTENEEYRSLPVYINDRQNDQHIANQHASDLNNNLFCRAEPDGVVSPSLELNDNLHKTKQSNFPLTPANNLKNLRPFQFVLDESEGDTQVPVLNLQRTALLLEPYLHSII